jgi:hypothetical protein
VHCACIALQEQEHGTASPEPPTALSTKPSHKSAKSHVTAGSTRVSPSALADAADLVAAARAEPDPGQRTQLLAEALATGGVLMHLTASAEFYGQDTRILASQEPAKSHLLVVPSVLTDHVLLSWCLWLSCISLLRHCTAFHVKNPPETEVGSCTPKGTA